MAVLVVERLEVVDIAQHKGPGAVVAVAAAALLGDVGVELSPVE